MAKIKLIGVVLLLLCCSAPRPAWRCEEQPALYREGAEVLVVDDLTVRTYRWPIWATVKGQRHGAWVVALEGSGHEIEVPPERVVGLRRCRRE